MATDQDPHQPSTNPANGKAASRDPRGRSAIFVYDLAIVALLIGMGAAYIQFPDRLTLGGHDHQLAIQSMWFGALGGVIISLKGIYDHADGPGGWDRSFNLWHVGRPISGAIAGLMTIVLLRAINPNSDPGVSIVYAIAFIFGTQERRFFNFLYEVARLIVQVPEETKAAALRITDVKPQEGSSGGVVIISGHGIDSGATVKLGGATLEKLTIAADGTSAAGLIPTRPMGADTVDVVVTNSTGAEFVFAKKFKYVA